MAAFTCIFRSILFGVASTPSSTVQLIQFGETPIGSRFHPADVTFRTANGELNDPFNGNAGSQGTFFGRNIFPADQDQKVTYLFIPS